MRVAEKMQDEITTISALLHDVIEDTKYTVEDLREMGFPEQVVQAVSLLTKHKVLITRLATCEYISEHRSIFVTGATGSGKTYMACAFGIGAGKQYFIVRYIRLLNFLLELEVAHSEGKFPLEYKGRIENKGF